MPASYTANSAQEFNQTGTGYQQASDQPSIVADSNLEHSGNAGPSGLQSGGFAMCSDFTWPPEAYMAYPPQDFKFQSGPMPSPSMNHGLNPSIPSHSVTQQHQWGTGGNFPKGDLSQNHFGAPPLFGPAGYANPVALAHLMQQSQSSSTTGNSQSNFPAPGIQVVDGRLDTEMWPEEIDIDEEIALGEHLNNYDSSDDNDSGYSQSDFGDDISDQGDPENMAAESFTGGDEGGGEGGDGPSGSGGSQIASSSKEPAITVMNQLLLNKDRRRKKHSGPQILPDTPYDASISSISNKLREAGAEPGAVDFLMRGIFPRGTISLAPLTTEMTPQEVDQFQVPPGSLKYHGLLRRDGEVVYCRLCPEDSQLDFEDPDWALHHIAKDHFEMAYSCDCGCNEIFRTRADCQRHRKRKGPLPPQAIESRATQALPNYL